MYYMTEPIAAFRDDSSIWLLDSYRMELEIFDALCVLRMAELVSHRSRIKHAVAMANRYGKGNAGADAFFKLRGEITVVEMVERFAKGLGAKRRRQKKTAP